MRYELNDAMLNDAMLKDEPLLNDESLDALPDELAELALQLGNDADRLTGLYPARPTGIAQLEQPAEPARPAVASRSFWPAIRRVASLSRVAAAVCILGGLALAISSPSIWRGMFGSAVGGGQPLIEADGGADRSLVDVHTQRHAVMQPIFISTEAMRQFSGEETEILADAIPHGESAVVIADL